MKKEKSCGAIVFYLKGKKEQILLIKHANSGHWSFPKGHVEAGETALETAIRETAEETKREASVITTITPYEEHYTTPKGEACVCYMFLALDNGPSDNDSTDTHDLVWTPFEKVETTLSYPSLKTVWNHFKPMIEKILNKKED